MAATGYDTNFSGILLISQADYDAMAAHDPDTRYTVRAQDGSVREYLGSTPITMEIVTCTQAQYDAAEHSAATIYGIQGGGTQ